MVLVQRAHRGGADGVADGLLERPPRHRAQRGLVQDRLGRGRRAPLPGEQPGLEGGRAPDGGALEQVRSQPGQGDGVRPGPRGHHLDVDHRTGREREHHRVSVDGPAFAQRAPDLGQAPPQRPDGIVGPGEQQGSELAARGRVLAQDEVCQQAPALAAPELVHVLGRPRDPRAAEELDGDAHRPCIIARTSFQPCPLMG
ncbi:MAG TPA: hypothetical protein VFV73_02585 [Streptosporangiaceae bacterium]|nr:hypothetical protein [Streptosporangiaceae bacterium]